MSQRPLPEPSALARRRASAETIAREAAAILLHHRGRLNEVTWKGAVDLVTVADRSSEAFVIAALHKAFPEDRIVGEEGGGEGPVDADFVWYVDPLDGTTNFVHGLPHFAVSLGSVHRGEPLVGVIHAPALSLPSTPRDPGIVWSAASGLGASRNDRPIAVAAHTILRRALVATGFPYDRPTHGSVIGQRVESALAHCLDIRRLGSAALDLAQVADGTFGAYWEGSLKPWDMAAGLAIVRAAGGRVTDLAGGETMLASGDVLATNTLLHAAFLADVLGV